jgi:ribonuclease Z
MGSLILASLGFFPLALKPALHHRVTPRCISVCCSAAEDEALLSRCAGSAEALAEMLSKDDLKEACAARSLSVSGTKAVLAPRLLSALQPPSSSGPPPPSAIPAARPSRRSAAKQPAANAPHPAADGGRRAAGSPRRAAAEQPARGGEASLHPAADDGRRAAAAPAGSGADLELTILGSGACNPTPWRGASCSALRIKDSYWLFDVGEGTQERIQRAAVRPGKIDKIFVTHAHGDHCFGLPGMLCLIARGRDRSAPPLEIYGPVGLRAFVRIAISFTGTRMVPEYVVHELHGIPHLHPHTRAAPPPPPLAAAQRPTRHGEVAGGGDVRPGPDGTWALLDTGEVSVRAAPVTHTVPCVGFVVEEAGRGGRLLIDRVMPRLEANRAALREQGVRDPRTLLKAIKRLGQDESMALPDGSVLRGSEVLGAARRGRKVAILGDNCDATLLVPLARGADLVIHEATNAYLPASGDRGGVVAHQRETARHGHSTPQMAGRFARRVGAKALLLSHFSQRYHPARRGVMRAVSQLAAEAAGLAPEAVAPAYDTLTVPIWQHDREKPPLPPEALAGGPAASSRPTEEEEAAAAEAFEASLAPID